MEKRCRGASSQGVIEVARIGETPGEVPSATVDDPVRQPRVMTGDYIRQQTAETVESLYRPLSAGRRVIDAATWRACNAFQMGRGICIADHVLKISGVFSQVMPERSEVGRIAGPPFRSEFSRYIGGRGEVGREIVPTSINRISVGNRDFSFMAIFRRHRLPKAI